MTFTTLLAVAQHGGVLLRPTARPRQPVTTPASAPFTRQGAPERSWMSFAGASWPRAGPRRRPSPTSRKGCRSRPSGAGPLLGDRVRLAQGRSEAEGAAAVHHRDRWAGHPLHSRALEARRRVAAGRLARLARLDHRAAQDHRPADQSHGPWRRAPSDAFHVVIPSMPGYGFSGKPTTTGWGPERMGRAWAELMQRLGLHSLRRAGRRLGGVRRRSDGPASRPRDCSRSTPTCPPQFRPTSIRHFWPAPLRRPGSRPRSGAPTGSWSGPSSKSITPG